MSMKNPHSRNPWDDTPLHLTRNIDELHELVAAGADIHALNQSGRTPLHNAFDTAQAKALIEYGADIHARDDWQMTPLHCAASKLIATSICHELLEAGADVNARDKLGRTALHGVNNHPSARTLIWAGADPYAKTNVGQTALETIRSAEIREIVELEYQRKREHDAQQTAASITSAFDAVKPSVKNDIDKLAARQPSRGRGGLEL